ncbi:MAG: UvrD-helicase domain-containing protein, partial [Muribaculaceae bacterium]|nr:UvrD-helicase domain-containing protein [Muribaculaceae bacterium]
MLTIYKASAGSGKTFTLTYEYIKSLLGVKQQPSGRYCLNAARYLPGHRRRPDRHRGILAITFTNAATEEMKSRIVRELSKLATDEAAQTLYAKWLVEEFGCTPEELRRAAAKALGEMLYDYGNFNVSTIDSFFQTVLRTFSREVDHQGDYRLELDSRTLMKQSVSAMLDDVNYMHGAARSRLVDWIRHFTFDSISRGKGYNIFN